MSYPYSPLRLAARPRRAVTTRAHLFATRRPSLRPLSSTPPARRDDARPPPAAVKRSAKRYRRAAIKRKAKNSPFIVHTNKVRATQLHVCVCYAVVVMRCRSVRLIVAWWSRSPRNHRGTHERRDREWEKWEGVALTNHGCRNAITVRQKKGMRDCGGN